MSKLEGKIHSHADAYMLRFEEQSNINFEVYLLCISFARLTSSRFRIRTFRRRPSRMCPGRPPRPPRERDIQIQDILDIETRLLKNMQDTLSLYKAGLSLQTLGLKDDELGSSLG